MIREEFLPNHETMLEHLRDRNYTPRQIESLASFNYAYRRCFMRGAPNCTEELESWLRTHWETGRRMQERKMSELNGSLPAPARESVAGYQLLRDYGFVLDTPGRYGQVRVRANLINRSFGDDPVKEVLFTSFQLPGQIGARKPTLGIYYAAGSRGEQTYERELRNGLDEAVEEEFVRYFVADVSRDACG